MKYKIVSKYVALDEAFDLNFGERILEAHHSGGKVYMLIQSHIDTQDRPLYVKMCDKLYKPDDPDTRCTSAAGHGGPHISVLQDGLETWGP